MRSPWTLLLLTLPSALFLFGVVGHNLYAPWPELPLIRWIGQDLTYSLMTASLVTGILGLVSGARQRKTPLVIACLIVNAVWLAFPLYGYISALVLWIYNTYLFSHAHAHADSQFESQRAPHP